MINVEAESTGVDLVELAKARAKRICQLSDEDMLNHQEDHFITSPLVAMSIYQHVRLFAAGFGELETYPPNDVLDREAAVTNVLLQMLPVYRNGAEAVALKHGRKLEDVLRDTPAADLLDTGLRRKYESSEMPASSFIYFFILALDELIDFVDLFNVAYRTTKQLRNRMEAEVSHKGVISALGALLSAQAAIEKGMHHMTVSLGTEKVNQLTAEITARDQRKSEIGKKAAEAKHNKPGGSRERKAKIQEIWATGKYSSRDICADQEWSALGYGSWKAARNALTNTPDPSR